jgi:hypothetical protein
MVIRFRTIIPHASTILCCVSAGGLLYIFYESITQPSSLGHHSSHRRRSLTFKDRNSTCPLIPPADTKNHFDFVGLYQYLQDIVANCSSSDTRLVQQHGQPFLTLDAARRWTGEKWNTWVPYSDQDILKRLLTWKLPLLNLLSQFGRQPLGVTIAISTIAHLVGDPIDTIASMFFTLHVCWVRVETLKKLGLTPREWKAVALVMQTFDECSGKYATLELESR